MPGELHDVVQSVSMDASGYHEETLRVIADNIALIESMDDVIRKSAEIGQAFSSLPDSKEIRVTAEVSQALAGIGQVRAALGALTDREITVKVRYVTEGDLPRASAAQGAAAVPVAGGASPDTVRLLGEQADAADRLTASLAAYSAVRNRIRVSDATIDSVTRLTAALNDLNAASSSAAMPLAVASALRGAGGNQAAAAAAAAAIGSALGGAPAGGAGDGGGGAAGAAAIAAALGAGRGAGAGGAGRGRGAGGGGGGFVPWAGGGWQAVRFWGMMAAEITSTVVPALVAAGAAALVGAQGFEQLQNRAQAVYTVSEALGPALGQTFGSWVAGGPYGNALQTAQTAAQGGVYQLAGAGIRLLGSGAGQGLLTEGTSTLAMIDRGVANMVLNLTQGGKGQRITDMFGGGTGYLQAFGDIGANIGNTLLDLAPVLPGVGADLLTALKGGTGALSWLTGNVPSPLLGGFLTYEAGSRWLPAILGGKGLIGRMLGLKGVGGLGGVLQKAGLGLIGTGSEGLGEAGAAIGTLGEGLMGLTGWQVGLPLALASLEWGLLDNASVTPAMRAIAGLQPAIAQGGFTGAWQPLAHAVTTVTGLAAQSGPGTPGYMAPPSGPAFEGAGGAYSKLGIGVRTAYMQSPGYLYSQGAASFATQMTDLADAGPQLIQALHKAGLSSVTMSDAFTIAQNSLLDLSHAFDSHGNLTKTAIAQMGNYVSGIAMMTRSGGAFGAAVSGQAVMSQGAMQNLSKVNQAMDSMTQIMTGGPVGTAVLSALLGGTPVTRKPTRAGMQLDVPPAYAQMAGDLTSFLTPAGAAAWKTFAGPQGLIASEQANLDQARTALTLGALTQQQATGITAYQLEQMLPLARKSPAALAMIMQQAAQMGIGAGTPGGGYYQGGTDAKSLARNYRSAVAAITGAAYTPSQVDAVTAQETIRLANIPATAQQFVQGMASSAQAQQVAAAAADLAAIRSAGLSGRMAPGAMADWVRQIPAEMRSSPGAMHAVMSQMLAGSGIGSGMQAKITAKIVADASDLQAKLNSASARHVTVPVDASTSQAALKIAALKGKEVAVTVVAHGADKAQAAVDSVHGKTVTVSVVEQLINAGVAPGLAARVRPLGAQTGGLVPGSGTGDIIPAMLEPGEAVVPRPLVPLVAPILAAHRVPGFGSPAGTSGRYAAGGIAAGAAGLADGSGVATQIMRLIEQALRGIDMTRAGGQISGQLAAELGRPPHTRRIAESLAGGIAVTVTSGPGAVHGGIQGIAQGLLAKLKQEIAYAKNVQSQTMQGLDLPGMNLAQGSVGDQMQGYLQTVKNFTSDLRTLSKEGLNKQILQQLVQAGPQVGEQLAQSILHGAKAQITANLTGGLNLAGMNVTPGTGNGSVADQMQSYASSLSSFQADLAKLSKQHLNKDVLQQILGAGPVQGDQLAQSILSSPGGVGQVNQLWDQIGKTASQIGSQFGGSAGAALVNKVWQQLGGAAGQLGMAAASGVYGGSLTTQSGTITNNNVTVNLNLPPGANILNMSPADLKKLLGEIESALQKKAKHNTKTPVKTHKPGRHDT